MLRYESLVAIFTDIHTLNLYGFMSFFNYDEETESLVKKLFNY